MNLITWPRHHIGKLKGFAYLLFEAFMRAYVDAYMEPLYHSCLVRWCTKIKNLSNFQSRSKDFQQFLEHNQEQDS